jgi:hypothetical protein
LLSTVPDKNAPAPKFDQINPQGRMNNLINQLERKTKMVEQTTNGKTQYPRIQIL